MLTATNGRTIGDHIELNVDQAVALGFQLIDAQVEALIRNGVPPQTVVEQLMGLASTWLARLEPLVDRQREAERLGRRFPDVVARKARDRVLGGVTGRLS